MLVVDNRYAEQQLSQEDWDWLHGGYARRLHNALSIIAGKCDGARALDNVGFNKYDAEDGHRLVGLFPSEWTFKDVQRGERLVRKYHRQLEARGLDIKDAIIQGRS